MTTPNHPITKSSNHQILQATGLHKTYRMGDSQLHVLRGVDLSVKKGEWLSIIGASGSGKSTFLHLLGGLDSPDQGSVAYNDTDVFALRGSKLDRYRNTQVGFVFQFYHLLPELSALENVTLAAMISHSVFTWPRVKPQIVDRATVLLESLGLGERMKHRPAKLSGGERQRVAIARALINEPAVLLADEPTGNLDANTGGQILDVFRDLHAKGQTIVMVTHDLNVAAAADRQVTLELGKLKR